MAKRGGVGPRLSPGECSRVLVGALLLVPPLGGCDGCGDASRPAAARADAGPGGISAEQARQVLARVGDREIRLGDYAAALERMDELERLRYQTKERRQDLLDEMINVELLAREAERRGLRDDPETRALIRQFQRDAVLERLRRSLPDVESFSASEVAEYYRLHPDDFQQPEMRRIAHVALADEATARAVLERARGADAATWRQLVSEHASAAASGEPSSPEGPATTARPAEDVPGDLGMLARQAPEGDDSVDPALREAAFAIGEEGAVHPEVVRAGGLFHVVRLVTRVAPRRRTLAEVDTAIRVRLREALQAKAELELVARLRESTPVVIDEAALSRVSAPAAGAAEK